MHNGSVNPAFPQSGVQDLSLSASRNSGHAVSPHDDPVLLLGGQGLAFEGLRNLLLTHGFYIAGMGRTLFDIDLSTVAGARQCLVVMDCGDSSERCLQDVSFIAGRLPNARIVILLDDFEHNIEHFAGCAGAAAVLDRNIACDALLGTLSVVLSGHGVLSPLAKQKWAIPHSQSVESGQDAPLAPLRGGIAFNLSDRELQIIACIAEGHSNKVIARKFSISEATVKIHVRGILRKIDARNRTQAAIWAVHHGFGSAASLVD